MIFTHGQTMWFVVTVNPKKHAIFHVDLENILFPSDVHMQLNI